MESTQEKETGQVQEEKAPEEIKGYHFLSSRNERIVLLLLLIVVAVGPIVFGESVPSHADWHIHMERAYNFKKCFWQGQFLPRWIDAQASGYGLPVYNFYAPLVYYIYILLELVFRNAILSMKWTFIIPVILCVVFGYLYLRRHGSAPATTIALAFLIFSPAIHIYIYNDNWPGSVLAIAFVLLFFYGIDSFDKTKDFDVKSFLITSFSYAALVLTHIATAFTTTLLCIPYFLLSLSIYRTKKFVKNFIFSLGIGGALAGFYLIPAALEKKLVHADEVLKQGPHKKTM